MSKRFGVLVQNPIKQELSGSGLIKLAPTPGQKHEAISHHLNQWANGAEDPVVKEALIRAQVKRGVRAIESKVDEAFEKRFHAFLLGRMDEPRDDGAPYTQTPIWGNRHTSLLQDPEVKKYVHELHNERAEFDYYIQIMKKVGPIKWNGKRKFAPPDMMAYYLYFKYVLEEHVEKDTDTYLADWRIWKDKRDYDSGLHQYHPDGSHKAINRAPYSTTTHPYGPGPRDHTWATNAGTEWRGDEHVNKYNKKWLRRAPGDVPRPPSLGDFYDFADANKGPADDPSQAPINPTPPADPGRAPSLGNLEGLRPPTPPPSPPSLGRAPTISQLEALQLQIEKQQKQSNAKPAVSPSRKGAKPGVGVMPDVADIPDDYDDDNKVKKPPVGGVTSANLQPPPPKAQPGQGIGPDQFKKIQAKFNSPRGKKQASTSADFEPSGARQINWTPLVKPSPRTAEQEAEPEPEPMSESSSSSSESNIDKRMMANGIVFGPDAASDEDVTDNESEIIELNIGDLDDEEFEIFQQTNRGIQHARKYYGLHPLAALDDRIREIDERLKDNPPTTPGEKAYASAIKGEMKTMRNELIAESEAKGKEKAESSIVKVSASVSPPVNIKQPTLVKDVTKKPKKSLGKYQPSGMAGGKPAKGQNAVVIEKSPRKPWTPRQKAASTSVLPDEDLSDLSEKVKAKPSFLGTIVNKFNSLFVGNDVYGAQMQDLKNKGLLEGSASVDTIRNGTAQFKIEGLGFKDLNTWFKPYVNRVFSMSKDPTSSETAPLSDMIARDPNIRHNAIKIFKQEQLTHVNNEIAELIEKLYLETNDFADMIDNVIPLDPMVVRAMQNPEAKVIETDPEATDTDDFSFNQLSSDSFDQAENRLVHSEYSPPSQALLDAVMPMRSVINTLNAYTVQGITPANRYSRLYTQGGRPEDGVTERDWYLGDPKDYDEFMQALATAILRKAKQNGVVPAEYVTGAGTFRYDEDEQLARYGMSVFLQNVFGLDFGSDEGRIRRDRRWFDEIEKYLAYVYYPTVSWRDKMMKHSKMPWPQSSAQDQPAPAINFDTESESAATSVKLISEKDDVKDPPPKPVIAPPPPLASSPGPSDKEVEIAQKKVDRVMEAITDAKADKLKTQDLDVEDDTFDQFMYRMKGKHLGIPTSAQHLPLNEEQKLKLQVYMSDAEQDRARHLKAESKKKDEAATKIQSGIRQFLAKKEFNKVRNAIRAVGTAGRNLTAKEQKRREEQRIANDLAALGGHDRIVAEIERDDTESSSASFAAPKPIAKPPPKLRRQSSSLSSMRIEQRPHFGLSHMQALIAYARDESPTAAKPPGYDPHQYGVTEANKDAEAVYTSTEVITHYLPQYLMNILKGVKFTLLNKAKTDEKYFRALNRLAKVTVDVLHAFDIESRDELNDIKEEMKEEIELQYDLLPDKEKKRMRKILRVSSDGQATEKLVRHWHDTIEVAWTDYHSNANNK